MRAHRRAILATSTAAALVACFSGPAAAAEGPLDTGFSWSADIPEITFLDLDVAAQAPCVVTFKGSGALAKAPASPDIAETARITARSSCRNQRLVVAVSIRDEVPAGLQPSYTTSSAGSGLGSASASASQTVDYFGRALSTVTFRYEIKASSVSQCWEHRFVVVGAVQAVDNGVAACA